MSLLFTYTFDFTELFDSERLIYVVLTRFKTHRNHVLVEKVSYHYMQIICVRLPVEIPIFSGNCIWQEWPDSSDASNPAEYIYSDTKLISTFQQLVRD